MALKVAVQMDPIERINIKGDSTFAMMLEAQARGHRLFYYQTNTLALGGGSLWATGQDVNVRDEAGNFASLGELRRVDLATFDTVLMRQDPPFDMAYITATHLLEFIHPKTLVVNDPAEVRNAPEKLFVLRYREFMPETLITRDPIELATFRRTHGDIILKPLYGNGGAGVFHIGPEDDNLNALLEMFTAMSREPVIVQKYIPEVRQGDKRIILVEGRAVGALRRVPPPGEARANLHVGARAEKATLDARDKDICAAIGPVLKEKGLVFVGIDVIGGFLTEINVTSPTGIQEIGRFDGVAIEAQIWDAIEARVKPAKA